MREGKDGDKQEKEEEGRGCRRGYRGIREEGVDEREKGWKGVDRRREGGRKREMRE